MSAADYAALLTGIAGVIGAVTALIMALRHNSNPQAHGGKPNGNPQS